MPERDVLSWSAMVGVNAQNGHLGESRRIFDEMPFRDVVCWNSMISSYAGSGRGEESLEVFHLMDLDGTKPDHVTFSSVLTACSHLGLLNSGWRMFVVLAVDHGVPPRQEHYASMIDILARLGKLGEAEELVKSMPFVPDLQEWATLLGASRVHRNKKLGMEAAKSAIHLGTKTSSTFVLLSDMYKEDRSLRRLAT
ncbi:hypothetical protein SELMODRAFT_134394 [Selaginella moellendorffii]|uniref:Pentacotripeptide-repeat region of PRORP domain-containing protein n=2 Tax=Selaginella moellendorffii TaxID=88036 RepID=D8T8L4_SELML|nr:hypothetical protein SELMODRAFT_134394 [Selaginella moellendorffii]